jgi:NAD(P)-dependent dehydrogenase (short-subunit alcohol dehydrogenase family)
MNDATARPLTSKVALVTGAGTRLGRAIAEGLGRLGADLALHHHGSAEGARAAAAAIRVDGNRAETFQADLSKDAEVLQLAESVEAKLGRVSVLVNSAAIYLRHDFFETPLAALDSQWALNARAPYLLSQAVGRKMEQGDIINVVDIGGAFNAWRHFSAYAMTKAALAALTQCLAVELAPKIRVNAVAPGTVLPPTNLSPEELEKLRLKIPAQRFGSPDDIVRTVGFLLTGPSFVTGQIIAVDGGRNLAT